MKTKLICKYLMDGKCIREEAKRVNLCPFSIPWVAERISIKKCPFSDIVRVAKI